MLPTDAQCFTQILVFHQQFENRTARSGVDIMVESDSCKGIYIWRARIQRIPKHYLCLQKLLKYVKTKNYWGSYVRWQVLGIFEAKIKQVIWTFHILILDSSWYPSTNFHPTELFTGVGNCCLYTGLDNCSKVTSENDSITSLTSFCGFDARYCCMFAIWCPSAQLYTKVCSLRRQKWTEVRAHSEYVACYKSELTSYKSELKYATFPLLSRLLVPCLALWIIRHFPTPGKNYLIYIYIYAVFLTH